jgi:hypothetical protein
MEFHSLASTPFEVGHSKPKPAEHHIPAEESLCHDHTPHHPQA